MKIDYSALDEARKYERKINWSNLDRRIVSAVSFFIIFFFWATGSGINADGADPRSERLFWLILVCVVIFPIFIVVLTVWDKRQRKKIIKKFADTNGLVPLSESKAYSLLPSAFKFLSSGKTENAYRFPVDDSSDSFIDVFEYDYSIPSRSNNNHEESTVAAFETKHKLPHIFLDAKHNGLVHGYDKKQQVHLEGNFSKYYSVFTPEMANIEMRQVLAPDVMQALVESGAKYDIEIENKTVSVFASERLYGSKTLEPFLAIVDSLRKDLANESVDWDVLHETVGDRFNGAGSTMLRRRIPARLALLWSITIALLIFLIQYLLVTFGFTQ